MARPKKGTPEGDRASEQWKKTMLEKYGNDGLHKKMQAIGRKGGSRSTPTGGFGADRERARIAGAKGGSISRRGEAKNWYDENEDKINYMIDDGCTPEEISKILGVTTSRLYYSLKKYGSR